MIRDYRLKKAIDAGVIFIGKRILEPSCGYGAVTYDLCEAGANVTSFDIRVQNLGRAFTRCIADGYRPHMFKLDADDIGSLGKFDLICHVGLLYHLELPATHLRTILKMAPEIILDTHVAPDDANTTVHDEAIGAWWDEGVSDYSSKPGQERSYWLERSEIRRIVESAGFTLATLIDNPNAENGPRVCYYLKANP